MKAIIHSTYGAPDTLTLKMVPRPEPQDGQVLIKVLAVSVNKADWHILQGRPFPVRLMAGLVKPKYRILGADIAGVVERIGPGVTQFRAGQDVFGDLSGTGFGGFAEYVVADETQLALKPANLTYEETAALPMAAVTALQGLRDKGRIKAGDEVLINGASGGVGGFAVQIAKALGGRVTAVCSTGKVGQARRQGADAVIDYTRDDFTGLEQGYDLIFDVVGNHPLSAIDRVLNKGGRYVACAFSMATMLWGGWKGRRTGKTFTNLLSSTTQADLQYLSQLITAGQLRPVIQRTFTLDEVPEALRLMGAGRTAGKLVVTI